LFRHQELSEKQKPPTHQGGGLIPPAEILFGEFPHHTSSGTFVPDQGHLSSPLPGCQTPLGVVPDVGGIVSGSRPSATKFCVIASLTEQAAQNPEGERSSLKRANLRRKSFSTISKVAPAPNKAAAFRNQPSRFSAWRLFVSCA